MDCNPPGSSVHEISQARTLEWGAIFSCRGSSWPFDPSQGSNLWLMICRWTLYHWATREALEDYLVQFSSVAQSCPTLCFSMNHSTPGLPVHHQLPESTQTHVHRVNDAIQPSHPLSPPSPPAPNPSQHQGLFKWVGSSHGSFSFSISPSNEHPGLISFRMDWLDLLVVQGTLKSLLQYHGSKASIFQRSAFFTVQPSHPYMTTGKTIALTQWTRRLFKESFNIYLVRHLILYNISRYLINTSLDVAWKVFF